MLFCFLQQLHSKARFVNFRLATHDPLQQWRPFVPYLPRKHHDTKHDCRQGALRQAVIVLSQPTFETRAPEPRHVHTDRLVSFVATYTPLVLARHEDVPILKQFVALPGSIAQRCPTAANFRWRKSGGKGREEGAATLQECTAHHDPQDVHQGYVGSHWHRLDDGANCMYSVF